MPFQCWADVEDGRPRSKQPRANVSRLLGRMYHGDSKAFTISMHVCIPASCRPVDQD